MNAKIASAALGLWMCMGLCGIASAKNCKDVTINVKNNFVHAGNTPQIEVVDLKYWDNTEAKWRNETGVPNVVINNGKTRKIDTRNFEYVGGESGVRVQVQYKYMSASSGHWSDLLNAESDAFTCDADGPNTVLVTVTGI